MTVFENFQNMNIDELSEWLSNHWTGDGAPWIQWWDETYCQECECVTCFVPYLGKEADCAYCEIEHKCRFFKEIDGIPDDAFIVKLWLETQVEE